MNSPQEQSIPALSISMPVLRPNTKWETWRARWLNRLSQWWIRRKLRTFIELIDSGETVDLLAQAHIFRERLAERGSLSSAMLNQALDTATVEPAANGKSDWIIPQNAPLDAAILFVHGGAFVMRLSDEMIAFAARIANQAGIRTNVIDYRLSPEHPCPAALEDIEAALLGLYESGIDPSRIVLVGDSAAGSLLLSSLARMKNRKNPMPAGLALFSPWVDLTLSSYSLLSAGLSGESPYTMEMTALCAKLYLQDRYQPIDPIASPVYGDLSGLPSMLIHASEKDCFFDDAKLLTQKVHEHGGEVLLRVWPQGGHVWEHEFSEDADISIRETALFAQQLIENGST